MKPTKGQKNAKGFYSFLGRLYPLLKRMFPNNVCTLQEVGSAMINATINGYSKRILEVKDIKELAKG